MELLIMNRDNMHSDPIKDATSTWKKGDIVFVVPDNHPWGKEELNENIFKILKIPGIPVIAADRFRETWIENENSPDLRMIRRSRWRFDFDLDVFINKETNEVVPAGQIRVQIIGQIRNG